MSPLENGPTQRTLCINIKFGASTFDNRVRCEFQVLANVFQFALWAQILNQPVADGFGSTLNLPRQLDQLLVTREPRRAVLWSRFRLHQFSKKNVRIFLSHFL